MRIKMYMVYLPPEQIKSGYVTKVAKIPMSAYDKKIPCQASYAPGELLETKTHYRWEGHTSPEYFAVPAFQLCPEGDEKLDGCTFGYAISDKNEDFHKFTGPDEQGLYFDMPELKKEKGVFRTKNTLAGATLGSVQPGNTKLLLRDINGSIIFSWNLTIWPSSFEKAEFQRMIDEILCIDRQLLQFRPEKREDMHRARKIGLNLKRMTAVALWEQTLHDMEQDVNQLGKLFHSMEKRPHFALHVEPHKCRLHHVMRIDQDILRQYAQMPSRQYYRTFKSTKSLDIYEHRFLKQTLGQLLMFLKRHTNSLSVLSDGVEAQKFVLLDKMRQTLISENQIPEHIEEKQILAIWDQYVQGIRFKKEQLDKRKESFSAKFVRFYEQSQYTPSSKACSRISFRVARLSINKISCSPEELRWEYVPQWQKNGDGKFWKSRMIQFHGCSNIIFIDKIIFHSWDIGSQYAFYHGIIEEVTEDKNVSAGIKITVVGNFDVRPIYRDSNKCEINFFKLDELYIDNRSVPISKPKTNEWIQQVNALGDAYGVAMCHIDDVAQISLRYGVAESIESQRQILKHTHSKDYLREMNNVRLSRVRQKIMALLESDLFAGLSTESNTLIPWQMTQIFTNDKNYNAAYKLLLDMDKRYDFSLEVTDEFIIHEKLDKLYEYWILAKILEYLVLVQGWHSDGSSPSKILRSFLQQDNRAMSACISLQHEGIKNIKLDIYYDTPVKNSVGVSADAQDPHADQLKPDFLFRLSLDAESLYFILDAKYRDYAAMDGCLENAVNQQNDTYWWKSDMYDVCYNKYFNRLSRIGVPVCAAFIAHSDKKGIGEYVTYDAYHDKRCVGLFEEPMRKCSPNVKSEFETTDKICRIGSFYIVPCVYSNEAENLNQSEQNLQAFFQMLCEDYAGAWRQCWRCGSPDVETEVLYTKTGYKKYHLRCQSCQAFWVKTHCFSCGTDLVKHDFNHYVESNPRNHWMVFCPRCGANGDDKKQEEKGRNYSYDKRRTVDVDDDIPF